MIEGVLLLWYLLTAGSLIFLVWDLQTNTPVMWVMKFAWILIVLYSGPIGLFIYLLSCREPLPGTHDRFIAAPWKQAVGSLMHCVAGDATGIILAAAVTYYFGFSNGIDLIIEYLAAFVMGLLIFQALFMKASMGGNYLTAVSKTFYAETVSMNMVMAGMIQVMMIAMHAMPGSDDPLSLRFWGIMSLAAMIGGVAAYPVNAWMVRRGLKHGMMTAVPETSATASPAMKSPEHESHMDTQATSGGDDHAMQADVPRAHLVSVFLLTAACLVAGVWVTSLFVPLRL